MNSVPPASSGLSIEESATGSARMLYFRDKRPPHEVKSAIEREMMTLFSPAMDHDKFYLTAKAKIVGAEYEFCLRFESASPLSNCYSLRMDVSWPEQAASNADYYRKSSASWFTLWTRDFIPADPRLVHEGSAQLYSQLSLRALNDEKVLDSVPAIQQAIVAAMKKGATFRTSHKEGGTKIYWKNSFFVRSDCGDDPNEHRFNNETEFLKMLRQFCNSDVTRNTSNLQLSEIDTWRLMIRRLDPE